MKKNVLSRLTGYGGLTASVAHCPDCGAPLLTAYAESHTHGLQLVVSCAADCGYSRQLATSRPRISGYWRRDAKREGARAAGVVPLTVALGATEPLHADAGSPVTAASRPLGTGRTSSVDRRSSPVDEVRGDDPELASYLRIEERELETGGRN